MSTDSSRMSVHETHQLLEQGFIFERLMQLLKAEDLWNCRLVCRGWRDVFKSLPVALPSTQYRSIEEIMGSFPGAAAMSIKIDKGASAHSVFRRLLSAHNLRQLSIHSLQPWANLGATTACLASLTALKALSLSWHDEEGCPAICASLQHFTNLTTLKLMSSIHEHDALNVLSQLKKLKELHLRLIVYMPPGDEMFLPVLAQMTHLDVDIEHYDHASTWNAFELIQDYRQNLRSLAFAFPRRRDLFHDMSPLTSFARLEVLRVYSHLDHAIQRRGTNFLTVLEQMRHLTRLEFDLKTCAVQTVLQAITSLTSLKHLCCKYLHAGCISDSAPRGLSALTQLTNLCLSRAPDGMSLRGMTSLVELEVSSEAENILKLEESLEQMPHLQKLSLGFGESRQTGRPRNSLIQLKEMKKLRTRYICNEQIISDVFNICSRAKQIRSGWAA